MRVLLSARVLVLLGLIASGAAPAESLDGALQQHVRAATFEVVQKKPEEDPAITYDRPLPLELIPFQQRNDKYRSVGTAFAIGGNRYVTAAHVFLIGAGSQYGPLQLRDAEGTVYSIDKIWKFSDTQDFTVFSLRAEPKGVQPLELGSAPALNAVVYAVGNALGEGIVIRDGVYTSETPEEQNGEWQWMRFSAAASPGNSGGPLIDGSGRVVGVVLRKSQSENLNYALPIGRVSGFREGEGRLGGRAPIRLPIIDASETVDENATVTLPKTPDELSTEVLGISIQNVEHGQRDLLAHNSDRLFPRSASSSQLLHSEIRAVFPRVMREGQDGVWVAQAEQTSTAQLDHNGLIELSHGITRLRKPDDVPLASLYADTKLYMDLLLKGYTVRRQVGSESVKVTSLGKAASVTAHTDAWGRHWQVVSWNEPWSDEVLVSIRMPTPEGYVSLLAQTPSGFRQVAIDTELLLLDYIYVSLGGTLGQWQEYLAQKSVAPKALDAYRIEVDPAKRVYFHSPRCELSVTPSLLPLSRESELWLRFAFFRDGDSVVWDVGGLTVGEGRQKPHFVAFWRINRPDADLPERFQNTWRKIQAQEFPYNGTIATANGATHADTVADVPGGDTANAAVRYTLVVEVEGDQTQDVVAPQLELLKSSFKTVEH